MRINLMNYRERPDGMQYWTWIGGAMLVIDMDPLRIRTHQVTYNGSVTWDKQNDAWLWHVFASSERIRSGSAPSARLAMLAVEDIIKEKQQ